MCTFACVFVSVYGEEEGKGKEGKAEKDAETNMASENTHIQEKHKVKLQTDKGWWKEKIGDKK